MKLRPSRLFIPLFVYSDGPDFSAGKIAGTPEPRSRAAPRTQRGTGDAMTRPDRKGRGRDWLVYCWGFLFILAIYLFTPTSAFASEGTAILSGPTETRCYLASILIDENRYKILASCRDLTVPPESETLFYRLWAKRLGVAAATPAAAKTFVFGRGVYFGLGDITSGKLAADSRDPFDEILITAEKETNPSNPNLDKIILSGSVQPIDYGPDLVGIGETLKPTSPLARVTLEPTPSPTPVPGQPARRNVVATAFRIFLIVLLIIVAVAIIISVIQRRSASK